MNSLINSHSSPLSFLCVGFSSCQRFTISYRSQWIAHWKRLLMKYLLTGDRKSLDRDINGVRELRFPVYYNVCCVMCFGCRVRRMQENAAHLSASGHRDQRTIRESPQPALPHTLFCNLLWVAAILHWCLFIRWDVSASGIFSVWTIYSEGGKTAEIWSNGTFQCLPAFGKEMVVTVITHVIMTQYI